MNELLTQRHARLRSAAVAALCGLALVQVAGLPYALAQARHVAALSALVAIGCVALAVALAVARTPSAAAVWRFVAAAGALMAGGWALTRAVPVPGLESGLGRWTTAPGLASAGLGLACAGLAVAGCRARPSLAGAVCLLKAFALVLALAPAAGVLLVALGPGPSGGENTISGAPHSHGHVHASAAAATFRPGFGGHAGHYIYPNATPPRLPSWALALAVGAAALLTHLAAAALRRRSSPPPGAPDRSIATGPVPGALAGLLLVLVVLAAAAPAASAHATLLRSVPPAATHVAAPPAQVRLTFSEPVQILRPSDVSVVDGRGRPVTAAAPRSGAGDARIVTIPLRRRLLPDSYTVRYRVISADSHDIDDALVFALGAGRFRAPVLRGAGGLSETGPWAVGARFAELTALGLLLGLLAFRSLAWGPALRAARHLRPEERATALAGGSRLFWRAFFGSAGAAGLAEVGVLAAKSAVVFHTGFAGALADPAAASRLVAASRFGDLLGWRSALLLAIVAVAFWEWAGETSGQDGARAAGRPRAVALMALLSFGALAMLSIQGHASQAPPAALSVLADAIHLGAAGIWIGGLLCVAAVLLRLPAALPEGGRRLAALVLARFSRLAFAAVGLIVLTGLLRVTGELSRVAELWSSDYGRSLVMKSLLLCPVALLALRNRRAIRGLVSGAVTLRAVRRNVRMELAIGLNIVVIAALLVAQIPGRDAPSAAVRARAVPAAPPTPAFAGLAAGRPALGLSRGAGGPRSPRG